MKKLLTVALFLGLFVSCSENQDVVVGNKTTMEITPMIYDAGEVIKGEIVNAKFEVKNTGEFPLVFGDVRAGCSCTVADHPEEPVAPGETGIIRAHVKTSELGAGTLNKGIRVVTNTEPSIHTLAIRADVMTK